MSSFLFRRSAAARAEYDETTRAAVLAAQEEAVALRHAVVRTEHSIHYPGRGGRLYAPLEALLTPRVDRVICVCEASRRSHASRFPREAGRFVTVLNGVSTSVDYPSQGDNVLRLYLAKPK